MSKPKLKPGPSVGGKGAPPYSNILECVRKLLSSLNATGRFPGWNVEEELAERYALLRMKLLEETVEPKFTGKQTAAKLAKLERAANALAFELATLNGSASDAMNNVNVEWCDPHDRPEPTLGEVERIAWHSAAKAKAALATSHADTRRGPPASSVSHEIAAQAASDFHKITGRRPSRSTNAEQFPDFLGKLFSALQIEGDPSSYVQSAVEGWRAAWNEKIGR